LAFDISVAMTFLLSSRMETVALVKIAPVLASVTTVKTSTPLPRESFRVVNDK